MQIIDRLPCISTPPLCANRPDPDHDDVGAVAYSGTGFGVVFLTALHSVLELQFDGCFRRQGAGDACSFFRQRLNSKTTIYETALRPAGGEWFHGAL